MVDYSYHRNFKYRHDNPYHQRLVDFSSFVFRDDEAELLKGKWNQLEFKRKAPLCLEIGTGYGHFMREYCLANPQVNFVGMDYRFKRSFQLAKKLSGHPARNFRYLRAKGERVQYIFAENEVDNIFFFFPDPWPKTRHHKNRLFQSPFLKSAYGILKPGGKMFIKTDHDGYARWISDLVKEAELFELVFYTANLKGEHSDHFLANTETKFEKIFLSKGIPIKGLVLESKKSPQKIREEIAKCH